MYSSPPSSSLQGEHHVIVYGIFSDLCHSSRMSISSLFLLLHSLCTTTHHGAAAPPVRHCKWLQPNTPYFFINRNETSAENSNSSSVTPYNEIFIPSLSLSLSVSSYLHCRAPAARHRTTPSEVCAETCVLVFADSRNESAKAKANVSETMLEMRGRRKKIRSTTRYYHRLSPPLLSFSLWLRSFSALCFKHDGCSNQLRLSLVNC